MNIVPTPTVRISQGVTRSDGNAFEETKKLLSNTASQDKNSKQTFKNASS